MNALQVIRNFFNPGDDYTINILDHQLEEPISWRLDFGRGTWIYLEWTKGIMVASSEVFLTDGEVYGFFKALFPKMNIRLDLANVAVGKLQVLIKEVIKEASP